MRVRCIRQSAPAACLVRSFAQVKDHPDYARFFKMLAVGVPAQAVRNKMALEGISPDLLDTPDAPLPS